MASDQETQEAIYNITSEFEQVAHEQENAREPQFSPPPEFADESVNLPEDVHNYIQEFKGNLI